MESTFIVFPSACEAELRREEVSDPEPGEMVLQTLVSLVSTGTEIICFLGEFEPDTNWASWVKYPFRPGYCNVGKVVQVGEGVTRFAEGDRVFSFARHRQFVKSEAENPNLIKIPEHISDEEAAWCKLATISQSAVRHGEHALGDTAVVVGVGPIGHLVAQYLRVQGQREVLVVDTSQKRLDLALAHGATHAFCGNAADAVPFVEEFTEGQRADVAYDATGHHAAFPLAQKLVRDLGTVVVVGDSPHPSRQHLTHDLLVRGLKVRGSFNEKLPLEHSLWTFPRQAQLFLTYLQRGQMRVNDLVTHRLRPADAPRVYADLRADRGETMGVIFDWR